MISSLPPLAWAIRKFIYGQSLFWALRVAIGIFLPCLVLLLVFGQPVSGIAAATGALCMGLMDLPSTLTVKWREMGLCALIVVVSALLMTLSMQTTWLLWLTVLLITIVGAYAMQFGLKAGLLGLNSIVTMAIALSIRGKAWDYELAYLSGVMMGTLWYLAFGLGLCALLRHQMHRRALADELFATASQIRARAMCYDPAIADQMSSMVLLKTQNLRQQRHLLARDLILGELNESTARGPLSAEQLRLYNLMVDCVALFDLVLASPTDFSMLKRHAVCHPMLRQLHDILEHAAQWLDEIAVTISLQRRLQHVAIETSHLHALEQTFNALPMGLPKAVIRSLQATLQRIRDLHHLVAKLAYDLHAHHQVDKEIQQILHFYRAPTSLFTRPSNWRARPVWTFTLRLGLAVAVALGIATWLNAGHDNWIVMTTVLALRPSFGQSWSRSIERVKGTAIGCILAVAVLALSHNPVLLVCLAFFVVLLGLSVMTFHFLLSASCFSMVVIWAIFLLTPQVHVIETRLVDTLIGASIALLCSHLYPDWEALQIKPKSDALVKALKAYLDELTRLAPETLIARRAAQREAMTSLMQLTIVRDNMLQEPKETHQCVQEVQDLLLLGHSFLACASALQRQWQIHADAALQEDVTAARLTLEEGHAPSWFQYRMGVSLTECSVWISQTLALLQGASKNS